MTCDNVAACSGARIDDTRRKEGITVKIVSLTRSRQWEYHGSIA